jgi:hypothetical protein
MQMEKNKSPGLDEFPAELYNFFWIIIKIDLMNMFANFQQDLPLFHLNYSMIVLLHRKEKCNLYPII